MNASEKELSDVFRSKVSERLTAAIQPLLTEAMHPDNAPVLMQPLYETMARQLGLLDGYAAMMGVPKDARMATLRHTLKHARENVLESHDADCPGCEAADTLRAELASEH